MKKKWEGREEGREEGRKGGREEGRKGGREEGRKGGREEGRKGDIKLQLLPESIFHQYNLRRNYTIIWITSIGLITSPVWCTESAEHIFIRWSLTQRPSFKSVKHFSGHITHIKKMRDWGHSQYPPWCYSWWWLCSVHLYMLRCSEHIPDTRTLGPGHLHQTPPPSESCRTSASWMLRWHPTVAEITVSLSVWIV